MSSRTEMPAQCLKLEREDQLWSGLSFDVFDEEELAHRQAASGDRVHQHDGVWWRELKFGFCQPCFAYSEVDHREARPHPLRAPAGYVHVAVPDSPANLSYRTLLRDSIQSYSLQGLGRNRRKTVRRVLAHMEVRPVERLQEMLEQGYEVYASWHTRVGWGADKTRRVAYEAWITRVFHPRQIILGAYREGRLVAFMLPKVVRHIASPSFVASHSDALADCPNDALYHAFLSIARQTPGVTMASFGPVSNKASLDNFKLAYSSIKELPSYLWVNPVIRMLAGDRLQRRYPWIGTTARGATAASISHSSVNMSGC